MTNNVGLLMPEPGFHDALRAITRETGTVLAYDETHTQVVGPGGLTRMWSLQPDVVTIGKSIAGGVPLGAYGMTEAVADILQRPDGRFDEKEAIATGGTLFGNPLSMAAARATLGAVLTDDAYTTRRCWAAGSRTASRRRSATPGCRGPRTASGPGRASRSPPRCRGTRWRHTRRRTSRSRSSLASTWRTAGVWEAIVGAGPTCPVPATEEDVDRYIAAYGSLIAELTE